VRGALVLAVALLVLVVAGLAVNAYLADGETEPARAGAGEVVELPGPDLHAVVQGPRDGAPIVLLHCYTCSTRWWGPVAERLAREHRVIALDLVGHGRSEKPLDGYAMEEQALQVRRALDRLGVERPLIAGHSMGGDVATAFAESSPREVAGIVIVGTAPAPDDRELPLTARLGYYPLIGPAVMRLASDSMVADGLESAFGPDTPVPAFAVEDLRGMTYRSYDRSADAAGRFLDERSLRQRLTGTGVRVLDIQGELDELVDPDRAKAGWGSLEGARVESLAGIGHSPPLEAPARTARLIADFADELDRQQR
jgi:pimeloyl-ACP methyl ester carboxylesterase